MFWSQKNSLILHGIKIIYKNGFIDLFKLQEDQYIINVFYFIIEMLLSKNINGGEGYDVILPLVTKEDKKGEN